MVNQVMQTASIMAKYELSLPSGALRLGSVFTVMPMVDTTMKMIEITLTI
jgi:hypothetical protein